MRAFAALGGRTPPSSVWKRHVVAIVVVLVALLFGWDGIRIAPVPPKAFRDAALMQTGAQCIVDRCDPYSAEATMQEDVQRGALKVSVNPDELMYPPSTYLLLLPMAYAGWPQAGVLWCWFGVLLVAGACANLVEALQLEKHFVALLSLLAVLISLPLHAVTGAAFNNNLHTGNATLGAAPLVVLACLLLLGSEASNEASRLRSTVGWIFLGIALALKPHLGLGAFLALFSHRRTRSSSLKAAALSTVLIIFAVLVFRLRLGSFLFLQHWAANSRLTFQPGHILDISMANPIGQDMLGLQRVLYFLGADRPWPGVFAWSALVCVIAATILINARNRAWHKLVWSSVALCVLASVLAMYHAKYDRLLFLVVIPALAELHSHGHKAIAWLVSVAGAFWVLSEQIFHHVLGRAASWPVNQTIPLLLCVALLWAMSRQLKHDPPEGLRT